MRGCEGAKQDSQARGKETLALRGTAEPRPSALLLRPATDAGTSLGLGKPVAQAGPGHEGLFEDRNHRLSPDSVPAFGGVKPSPRVTCHPGPTGSNKGGDPVERVRKGAGDGRGRVGTTAGQGVTAGLWGRGRLAAGRLLQGQGQP